MVDKKKEMRKHIRALKKAHDERAVLTTKVESAQEKLKRAQEKVEKRTRKLQSLEARIAELTNTVSATRSTLAADGSAGDAASDNAPEVVESLPDDPAASE